MLRTIPLSALGAAIVLCALFFGRGYIGASTASAITNCDTATAALDATELRMLELVNGARAAEGRGPLVSSASLNRAAAWKSEDAAKTGLSHTDSLGRGPFQRMPDCGYPNSGLGENVGVGGGASLPSTEAMFNQFMASPGHRAAILLTNARAIGLGRSGGNWTMNFGGIDDSGAPQPSATPSPTPKPKPTPTPTAQPLLPSGRAIIAMISVE